MNYRSLPTTISPLLPRLPQKIVVASIVTLQVASAVTITATAQAPNPIQPCPNEEPITIPSVEKKLIRIGPSRTGDCITPDLIFIHATNGGSLDSNWSYFDGGGGGGNNNAQFIVGEDGTIYQTVEMYQTKAEYAITNTPYNTRSIGIEMVHDNIEYTGKDDVPSAQYNATLQLVGFLMQQYGIPLGEHEADWQADPADWFNQMDPEFTSGVYGHYQISPLAHSDPGQEMFAAFRDDLRSGGFSSTSATGAGGGGRIVPYDAYARPYSWPTSGKIRQPYGFTEEAQSLGARYPGMYPIGDPSAIFSTDNHVEPPIDPATAKYINPNIDIEPSDDTASARAVYSTQAGWITFAGWAGPEKGYTIQIESDVEGDGQADLATRYMRLQAPIDGLFAPDIAEFYPGSTPAANPTAQNPAPTELHTPAPFVLEAENMAIEDETQARIVHDDSQASGGASVAFSDSTYIREEVERKADQLMIRAKSAHNVACFTGGGAQVEVTIDNSLVDTIEVTSDVFQTYPLTIEGLDGSAHELSLRLVNPGALLCERVLWVDAIHYVITNPNTPTIETVSQTTIEAEDLPDATEGDKHATVETDASASEEQYVAFTSNSKIEGEVEIPESNYFSIRARADLCGEGRGVPIISFSIDGEEVISLGVDQTRWTEYSYTLQPGASVATAPAPSATDEVEGEPEPEPEEGEALPHTLTIEFANDEFQLGVCDRNVYVDMISFEKFETTQTTYSPTSMIGQTKYVAFNQLIGYVSASRGTDEEWGAYQASLPQASDEENQNDPGGVVGQEALDRQTFISRVPNAQQTYLSYRIMYNNPNLTTFPLPTELDKFINAKVDDPYIVETDDNTEAGSLKNAYDEPLAPMFFFCALRQRGDNVRCIFEPNP